MTKVGDGEMELAVQNANWDVDPHVSMDTASQQNREKGAGESQGFLHCNVTLISQDISSP